MCGKQFMVSNARFHFGYTLLTGVLLNFVISALTRVNDVPVLGGMNRLLGAPASGGSGDTTDLPLAVDRSPGMLVSARISAEQLDYGTLRLTGARLAASLEPGRVVLEDLSGGYLGGKVEGQGAVESPAEPGQPGARISARLAATGLDVQALRRELGIGQIDLQGRMDGHVTLSAGGETLNGAMRAAHASAVVSMATGCSRSTSAATR